VPLLIAQAGLLKFPDYAMHRQHSRRWQTDKPLEFSYRFAGERLGRLRKIVQDNLLGGMLNLAPKADRRFLNLY